MTVGADDGCSCVCPLVCRMVDIIIHLIRVYVFLGSYVVFSTSVCVCVCVCVCAVCLVSIVIGAPHGEIENGCCF
jgi:hypothetical protein